ncbi:hypothetical protein [uncultured Tenacibaculum sp.]|uniref:hypothetical protein n=1 Tax=uncultured Tenacibaculum sp. TaxID=174713 RepID=UPI00262571D4|nr:hypothetical protein [uncultured Tenacibaculum sp.]
MEPTTVIAIASIAYSMLAPKPQDSSVAIIKMLQEINNKLNIINEKLDLILKEISLLPQKVEYERQLQNLKASVWQTKLLYEDYISDITNDHENGKLNFIANRGNAVNDEIRRIRDSFAYLKEFNDLSSINLCCAAITCDNELLKISGKDAHYIENINKKYFKYLKHLLYFDNYDNVTNQVFDTYNRDLSATWNLYKVGYFRQEGDGSSYAEKCSIIVEKAKFTLKDLSVEEKLILNELYVRGYIENQNKFLYRHIGNIKLSNTRINDFTKWSSWTEPYLHNHNGRAQPFYVRSRWVNNNFRELFNLTQYELIARFSTKELMLTKLTEVNSLIT